MSDETLEILTNREVLAVDQDWSGEPGRKLRDDGETEVWSKPMSDGSVAVILLNRGGTPETIATTADELGLARGSRYTVRDLWEHETTESIGRVAAGVAPHSAVMYRVSEGARGPQVPAVTLAPPVVAQDGPDGGFAYPGEPVTVVATFTNDGQTPTRGTRLELTAPEGWTVSDPVRDLGTVPRDREVTAEWTVTAPADAEPGAQPLSVTASYQAAGRRSGSTTTEGVAVVLNRGMTYLSDVAWRSATNGYGPVKLDQNYYGDPLVINGVTYEKGLWTNAEAELIYDLRGACSRLTADLGIDDSQGAAGSVVYEVWADGARVFDSGLVTATTPTVALDVDLHGRLRAAARGRRRRGRHRLRQCGLGRRAAHVRGLDRCRPRRRRPRRRRPHRCRPHRARPITM